MFGFKVINQYEQGIVFRFGKMLPDLRQPGLTWVNPFTDRLRKVNMQIITAAVPGQEGITRDNVTVRVDAVVYYRVINPVKALINVQDYTFAVSQVAQTSLRAVIGHSDLDQLLYDREKLTWTSCCPNGTRSTPSSRRSSTPPPRNPGVSGWSGSRSRTSPCRNR